MAFLDVTLTPEEVASATQGAGRPFVKFTAVGDKFGGYFRGTATKQFAANSNGPARTATVYLFSCKAWPGKDPEMTVPDGGVEVELLPPTLLARQLEKAALRHNSAIIVQYDGEKKFDTSQFGVKHFTVKVDHSKATAAPTPTQPPPQQPQAKKSEDDLLF